MKKIVVAVLLVTACLQMNAQEVQRERVLFNEDWRFVKNDPDEIVEKDAMGKPYKSTLDYKEVKDWFCSNGALFTRPFDSVQVTKRPDGNPGGNVSYTLPSYDDKSWRKLSLPHDWGIEGPFDIKLPGETGKLPWVGTGWYRKHFTVPSSAKNKCFYLDVDGAMAFPMVWLNGHYVGGWAYGYNSFRVDLTPYLKAGEENVLAIRVNNPKSSSRWYPGSGIYRNVWLVSTNPVHIGQWGTYITTPTVSKESASIKLKVTVDNQANENTSVTLNSTVYLLGNDGKEKKAMPSLCLQVIQAI